MKRLAFIGIIVLLAAMVVTGCSSSTATPTQSASATKPATAANTSASASTAASSASAQTTAAGQPVTGGILKTTRNQTAVAFGYPPKIQGSDADFVTPVFERLLSVGEGGAFKPELALSWEISADGKTITFKLRQGVKFHDGTPFNAAAVKFNYDACIAPNPVVLSGIASVEAVDENTVKINLSTADNLVLYNLASAFPAYIASPTAIQKNGVDWATTNPVGTGPFKMTKYDRNVGLTYAKNADYWEKGLPYLDGMEYLTIADAMTSMASFKKGEINQLWNASTTVAEQLKKDGYRLLTNAGGYYGLALDVKTADSPLANKKVREAIEYAIDKEGICAGPGQGYYKSIYQVFEQSSKNNSPDSKPRMYDPAKAKALLAEAGYANGFSFKAFFQDTTWKDGVTAVQQNLAAVGIKMEINYVQTAAFNKIRVNGEIEKGAGSMLLYNKYSNDLYVLDQFWRTTNQFFSFVTRPAGTDDLIAKAKASKDAAEIQKLTQQVAKSFYDDVTFIPLWTTPRIVVLDNSVQNPAFFINGDPANNYLGRSQWLKK
jgi:peptide/nickel transport system substrate-binding protein